MAGLVAGCLAWPAHANEPSLAKQLTEVNRITGTAPLEGHFRKLSKHPEQAKALLRYALAQVQDHKEPLSYNAAYELALTAQKLKDVTTSAVFYRICTGQAAKLESTRKLIQSYGGLIDLLYDNGKYADTVKVCQEIQTLKAPAGRDRIVLLAVTKFGEPDFEEIDHYNAAAFVKPAVDRILIQAVTKLGKYDQALKKVDELLKAQDTWEERQLQGWVLREAGKYGEAVKSYQEALDLVRKDKDLESREKNELEDRYRYILSTLFVDLKQIDRAAEELKVLMAKNPEEPGYQNDLGYIWADHDMNLPEAERLIRKALELDKKKREADPKSERGENGAYLDSLGWVLFKQKKLKEAREVLEKAVQDKASQHIEIYDHLGEVCRALGENDAAVNAWRRGLEVAGDTPRERQLRTDVQKKLGQVAK
jgi:tetratricopeptide (TPR) repeat protein